MARRAGSEIASGPRGLKCRRDPGGYAGEQGDAEADQRYLRVQRQVEVAANRPRRTPKYQQVLLATARDSSRARTQQRPSVER